MRSSVGLSPAGLRSSENDMREIKFRGLNVLGTEWHYGLVATPKSGDIDGAKFLHVYISNDYGIPFAYEVRPETVTQYTGLKDKNGKEIYEGDLFRGLGSLYDDVFHVRQCLPLCRNAWSYLERVGFFNGKKYTALVNSQTDISYDEILSFSEETEVIGSVFLNPDMFKNQPV